MRVTLPGSRGNEIRYSSLGEADVLESLVETNWCYIGAASYSRDDEFVRLP